MTPIIRHMINILKYFFIINVWLTIFLLNKLYIKLLDILIPYKHNSVYIKTNITWFGKIYINDNISPFVLYVKINEPIENPNMNNLEKYISIINGTPIADIPSNHINNVQKIVDIKLLIK